MNVRYVNYRIDENGNYVNRDKISTINVLSVIDMGSPEDSDDEADWIKKDEFILPYDESKDNIYVGLEDVRLYSQNEELLYNANRGLNHKHIAVEHGLIDLNNEMTISSILDMDNQREIEKNWVLFPDGKNTKVIYNWFPLVIGDMLEEKDDKTKFVKSHTIETPNLFKHLRGSTNGVIINDEIWFIVHTVSYEDRRYYYHMFVVLDKTTFAVKKYTPYFTFNKEKVEYTLGFSFLEKQNQLLIGYSSLDKSTEYIIVKKKNFDDIFITPLQLTSLQA